MSTGTATVRDSSASTRELSEMSAISRQIVEGLRGRIAAENRRDAEGRVTGARFIIQLPVA